MSNLDRDKFYSSDADSSDGDEYELEPPDPDVLAHERRMAQESIESARNSIDIDEVYRDSRERGGDEIVGEWFRNFRFQFQVKHLLIAMAAIAMVLVLWRLGVLVHLAAIGLMGAVFAIYAYIEWREKQYRDAADRRREEIYERARESRKR